MSDNQDPGWDAEARRDLARLDELLARWAEETGERMGTPRAGEARPDATRRGPGGRTPLQGGTGARRSRPSTRRWAWPSGILAAAAVVVILLARESRQAPPSQGGSGVPLLADGLDAASDKPFMVVPTRNPDIAVIWVLDSGD